MTSSFNLLFFCFQVLFASGVREGNIAIPPEADTAGIPNNGKEPYYKEEKVYVYPKR